jgi:hypothetical protein
VGDLASTWCSVDLLQGTLDSLKGTAPMIDLVPVNDLREDPDGDPRRFFVPAYQRGYRWDSLQVRQLLRDILEFALRRSPQPSDFYCLQPIVLKRNDDDELEVVDGQQRLTTLFLIMHHFNARFAEDYRLPTFELRYATRPGLQKFLNQPSTDLALDNADFYHINQAIQTIEQWFIANAKYFDAVKIALLNHTQVIWYELPNSENAIQAFTRLNVGKIPLTDDELIRALFLKNRDTDSSKVGEALKLQIAQEWDTIEEALQADAFWYFISNKPLSGHNRIGLIFDLVARRDGIPSRYAGDAHQVFFTYNERLNNDVTDVKPEWQRVKRAYMALEEWFDDRELFHLIGFLLHENVALKTIHQLAEGSTKSALAGSLLKSIWSRLIQSHDPSELDEYGLSESIAATLENLQYGRHDKKIRSILILFNIATLLGNPSSNIRLQFDILKREKWDIEHIKSVAADRPERHRDRLQWLEHSLEYLESESKPDDGDLREEILTYVALPANEADDSAFETLYNKVLKRFKEQPDEEADHTLANLTLLDSGTNRSYKNAVFAVKRRRILSLDQSGIYVPTCTRNVFLKCYSPQVDNPMFWSREDKEQYFNHIVDTLHRFFWPLCGMSTSG